ncbi:hypothetical protein [Hymenobacter cellulosilyticus]|uniref:Secreted protein n=1 Tax=Hymenobacter cellulosilyticus TaxID=2932248 RepID=A0A8T9Q3P5_9BACT|nr:hypothetical protein [Hymenobacter cellulosilyticus]UOQ70079.1 hypothetical protein MUN79_14985 [Hymenobacter cellulosilyticus]
MRSFLSLLVLLSTFHHLVIAQATPARGDTIATHYFLPQADCASFPAAAKLRRYQETLLKDRRRFTPKKTQIVKTEKALAQADLGRINSRPANSYYAEYPVIIKEQLPKYKRQYYGFYNTESQPCLFINFFIEDREESPNRVPSWLTDFRWTYDGGSAYWSVYYNLKTQKFYDFNHNVEG